MIAALVLSLSRSGIIAAAAEAIVGLALSLKAGERRGHVAIAAAGIGAVAISIALVMPRTSELIARFDRTLTIRGADGRTAIWRDTRAMIRDFPWTGVGAGAYPTGMLVYQQGSRLFFNNHAHDEYLQVIAEGGALVAVPLTRSRRPHSRCWSSRDCVPNVQRFIGSAPGPLRESPAR